MISEESFQRGLFAVLPPTIKLAQKDPNTDISFVESRFSTRDPMKRTIIIAFIVLSSNFYVILKFNSNVIAGERSEASFNPALTRTGLDRKIRKEKPLDSLMPHKCYAFFWRQSVLLCLMP